MKYFLPAVSLLIILLGVACRKSSFITSADALLRTSADTIHFDTVFTSTGSVTQSLKVFNPNAQKLRLSGIKLAGGAASMFRINVDGSPGVNFSDIELEANDSLYVFVSVTITPGAGNLPFVIRDSIQLSFNGNDRLIQLEAYGRNARFIRNGRISVNTTFNNNLPYVILGGLTIDNNVALNISRGTSIYCHANAPIIVNGTMNVNGTLNEKVVFTGDRLDAEYRDLPGSWPGIFFNGTSKDNTLSHAVIKNAYQGVITQLPAPNGQVKLTLNECTIDNIFDAGIISVNSSISARNCLITNCGNNIGIGSGGVYDFKHCTVATYGNYLVSHNSPVLFITNANSQSQTNALSAVFSNCVFYGEGGIVDEEIVVKKEATTRPFAITFQNVLYKALKNEAANVPGVVFSGSQVNSAPRFDSIDIAKRFYNFRPADNSPLIDAGVATATTLLDLDGKQRGTKPDIGCYEK
ncbi:hypothetical protein EXU57_16440 [Segetibacter sp. 3557_3]|uniref:hypothetical protein n=1 Tax=Segetibacter sp. 3557_3 TaxID=2547429 RepID=UPI0010586614|nr:hypothetical protein [Segetibacter sp. 3557_3]TDH24068.1 hypothetical protein EXU57_16440 [Segetibacter sp. 3557_3]